MSGVNWDLQTFAKHLVSWQGNTIDAKEAIPILPRGLAQIP